ncbi:MAG TPA: ribosome biogenesis GTPase Der, partial [Acidimicrobiales bacterium]|nr:ribosome biogenesis GTPase Der [Acidimicrobiales bacterium]
MSQQEPRSSLTDLRDRLPVVVIAGRPNVGKSTLVNRIVGRRAAIVEERPGVTRDRYELKAEWCGREFVIIDTGGVTERGDALDQKVTAQSLRAVADADVVVFVLDATTGPTAEDEAVAEMLRRVSHRVLVVANKVDSHNREADAWSLFAMGFGEPALISALHGRGVGDFLDILIARFPPPLVIDDGKRRSPRGGEAEIRNMPAGQRDREAVAAVAIVGRPNVGKSTLFNRLVGDERSVVHDVPGTTRDAIDTIIQTEIGPIRLIDTAGLRRKSRIGEGSEYYSLVRSLSAIDRADVSLLVIDG